MSRRIEKCHICKGTGLITVDDWLVKGMTEERIAKEKEEALADVVEVVRCKDCKFWTPMDNGISWHHQGRTDGECEKLWQLHCAERHLTNQDHFCGYGERKK